MKYIIVSLFFIISLQKPAYCQSDFTVDYYPIINRAELYIVDGNYKAALNAYDSAFKNESTAFAKDYFNALICATKIGAFTRAYGFCDSLIAKGVSKTFLVTYESLEPLRRTTGWGKYIAEYEIKYPKNIRNKALKDIFSKLQIRDQEFRIKSGSYSVYRDSIKYSDSINIAEIKNMISTIGFPNENMIDKEDPRNISFPGYIVFHHYCQALSKNNEEKYNFLDDFIKAVKKGQLDPYRFAYLISLQNEKKLVLGGWGVSVAKIGNQESKLLGELYLPEKQMAINANRVLYGLSTLEDYYKKAVFALKNEISKDFAFTVYGHKNIFGVEDQEQFEKFIKASIILE